MNLKKTFNSTLNYFTSKFYLENNLSQLSTFENLQNTWNNALATIETNNMTKSKKDFGTFINELKQTKTVLTSSTDKRLFTSLLALAFMVRRESNKQKSFSTVLTQDLKNLNSHAEFSKSKLLNTNKTISIKFPKTKKN